MGLFGRRDKGQAEGSDLASGSVDPAAGSLVGAEAAGPDDDPLETPRPDVVRTEGPWDIEDTFPDVPRVDLGALLVPQTADFRIQVQADQSTGSVGQVSLVTEASAVQLQPYAAPRSGGMWDEVRGQISSQINKSGGLVEEVRGSFGTELRAQVQDQNGKPQPARFCGVEGPRWFIRMVFLGQAARDANAAAPLETAVRNVVVVRGDQAMPMGNALPMRLPAEPGSAGNVPVEGAQAAPPSRPTITLPQRGPEITETR